jgi:hypothetical protein
MNHPDLNAPPNGLVLWEGPSRLDGAPIVALLTLRSANVKTGPMLQTWILPRTVDPLTAIKTGADKAVCGACPLRGTGAKARGCYVNLISGGPFQVYRAYAAGRYPAADDRNLSLWAMGRPVRLGSYGDPCAVPIGVWTGLLGYCNGHTGYTHQWRDPAHEDYRALLMASVESAAQRAEAKALGWRTYRILGPDDRPARREMICPASPQGGNRQTCYTCQACNGTAGHPGGADVTIRVHGSIPQLSAALNVLSSIP